MPAILAYCKYLKTISFWNGFKKCRKFDSFYAVASLKQQAEKTLTLLLIVRLNTGLIH